MGMRACPAVWWTDYEQRDSWQAEQRARDQAMLSLPQTDDPVLIFVRRVPA